MRMLPVIALATLALAGCGRSVYVEPLVDGEASPECLELVAALPETISAGRSWAVEPDSGTTKAWASPAVVLQCGAQGTVGPTDQLLTVDGIDWQVLELTDGQQYVTVGRTPGVSVRIPVDYRPTAAVLTDFSAAIEAHTTTG